MQIAEQLKAGKMLNKLCVVMKQLPKKYWDIEHFAVTPHARV